MTTYFVSNAGSNTAPYDTEAKAANSLNTIAVLPWAATDVVKLSSTHTETAGAAITYTFPATIGLELLAVLFNGSGTGGLTAGAAINVGAASAAFNLDTGFVYGFGITFASGTNNNSACDLTLCNTAGSPTGHRWDNCTFNKTSTTAGSILSFGPSGGSTNDDIRFDCTNCTFNTGGISISVKCGSINIDNMILAGTAPTSLFLVVGGAPTNVNITASDLSGVTWTNLASVGAGTYGFLTLRQCKLPSGFVVTTGTIPGPGQLEVTLIDCDSGNKQYAYLKSNYSGTIVADASVYADAGDNSNSFSLLMTGNANTSFVWPLVSPPMSWFNSSLIAMTTTVEANNDGTTFTDAQLWQETLAKVTSSSTMGTWNIADRAADILTAGVAQTASTKTWTGTGGFGAAVPQKLVSGSFTPTVTGPISVVVKLAANDNVYVSPKVFPTSAKQWASLGGSYINEQGRFGGALIVGRGTPS